MKKSEITVGEVYLAKVSGRVVEVRVDAFQEGMRYRAGGKKPVDVLTYLVTNLLTGKRLQFRSAMRFRGPASKGAKPTPTSVGHDVTHVPPYFGDGKDESPPDPAGCGPSEITTGI